MVLSVALLSALGFDSARAQTQCDPLQAAMALEPGELVAVEDDSGDRTKGRLREVTASAIVVETGDALSQRRSIPLDRIVRLSRVDGRLNGFLIGAAAGAVPGLLLGHGLNTYCNNEGPDYCPIAYLYSGALFAAVGGWIGWGVDNLIDRGTPVFSRRQAPELAKRANTASSFADLQPLVRRGQRIAVTNAAGTPVTGTVTDLSATSLSVQLADDTRATFAETQVQSVERIGDPLWNGALIGLGAGVAGGLGAVAATDCPDYLCGLMAGPSMALGAGLGLTAGLLFDKARQRRTVVFLREQAARPASGQAPWQWAVFPTIDVARRGVSVVLRF